MSADWRPAAIPGVKRRKLVWHADDRGAFSEIWRDDWATGMRQGNLSRSSERVLRGLHAHQRQADLWVIVEGRAFVGLVDLRPALSRGDQVQVEAIEAGPGETIYLPEGVAHGFYAYEPLTLLYLVTNEYDGSDEHGFAWNDTDAAVPWPDPHPILSERDASAPPLRDLLERLRGVQQPSPR